MVEDNSRYFLNKNILILIKDKRIFTHLQNSTVVFTHQLAISPLCPDSIPPLTTTSSVTPKERIDVMIYQQVHSHWM